MATVKLATSVRPGWWSWPTWPHRLVGFFLGIWRDFSTKKTFLPKRYPYWLVPHLDTSTFPNNSQSWHTQQKKEGNTIFNLEDVHGWQLPTNGSLFPKTHPHCTSRLLRGAPLQPAKTMAASNSHQKLLADMGMSVSKFEDNIYIKIVEFLQAHFLDVNSRTPRFFLQIIFYYKSNSDGWALVAIIFETHIIQCSPSCYPSPTDAHL